LPHRPHGLPSWTDHLLDWFLGWNTDLAFTTHVPPRFCTSFTRFNLADTLFYLFIFVFSGRSFHGLPLDTPCIGHCTLFMPPPCVCSPKMHQAKTMGFSLCSFFSWLGLYFLDAHAVLDVLSMKDHLPGRSPAFAFYTPHNLGHHARIHAAVRRFADNHAFRLYRFISHHRIHMLGYSYTFLLSLRLYMYFLFFFFFTGHIHLCHISGTALWTIS